MYEYIYNYVCMHVIIIIIIIIIIIVIIIMIIKILFSFYQENSKTLEIAYNESNKLRLTAVYVQPLKISFKPSSFFTLGCGVATSLVNQGLQFSTHDSKEKSVILLNGLTLTQGCKIDTEETQYQSCNGTWKLAGNRTSPTFGLRNLGNSFLLVGLFCVLKIR